MIFVFYYAFGCCGSAVISTPIVVSSSCVIGVLINSTVTVIVVESPAATVPFAMFCVTLKNSSFVFDVVADNTADKSALVFAIVYVAVAVSPFADNFETNFIRPPEYAARLPESGRRSGRTRPAGSLSDRALSGRSSLQAAHDRDDCAPYARKGSRTS